MLLTAQRLDGLWAAWGRLWVTAFVAILFSLLPSSLFPLLIKPSLSQSRSFLTFAPPILSQSLGIRSEQAAVWCLAAGQGQSTTIGIRGFLIVFTSKKKFLTILVPPHPVCARWFFPFQLPASSSILFLVHAEIWYEFNTSSKSVFYQNCQEAEITGMHLIL